MATVEERFWRKVEKTDGCWLWRGKLTQYGYGCWHWSLREKRWQAHRYAWTVTNGPIPEGLFVCHHCDVRACVRPDHLFVGTQADNLADASRKGRMPGNPTPCSDQAKRKIGDFFRGRPGTPHTEATKRLLSELQRGRPGRKPSAATLEKMRIAGLARDVSHLHTRESRAKVGAALRGKPLSEECKRKISLANAGKVRTPEMRERARQFELARLAAKRTASR